jgi:hypothetical protein
VISAISDSGPDAVITPSSNIQNALLVQPIQEGVHFRFDTIGIDRRELRLKFADNIPGCALPIAAFHNLSSRPHQAENSFGNQQNIALLGGFAQTAARAQPRLA